MALNMEGIDWKRLSQREKILVMVTLLVVLGLGFYMLEYKVQKKKLASVTLQLEQVSENITSFEMSLNLAQGGNIHEKIITVRADIVDLNKEMALLKDRMTANCLDIVYELSRQADFQWA